MTVPNTFANATTAIPLVQLDQNFNTGITLGNTTVFLGNTTTTLGNVTLTGANVTAKTLGVTGATSGSTTITPTDAVTATITLPNITSTLLAVASAGTANQKLFMNAAGTAQEFAAGISIVSTTWDVSTTGSFAITGAGFKPKAVVALSALGSTFGSSIGFTVGSAGYNLFNNGANTAGQWSTDGGTLVVLRTSAGGTDQAVLTLASLDADGVTLTKSKSGAPTGTGSLYLLFFR